MGKFPQQTAFFPLLRGNHPRPNPQFSCCFNLQQSEAEEPNVNYDLFPKKIAVLPDLFLWIYLPYIFHNSCPKKTRPIICHIFHKTFFSMVYGLWWLWSSSQHGLPCWLTIPLWKSPTFSPYPKQKKMQIFYYPIEHIYIIIHIYIYEYYCYK